MSSPEAASSILLPPPVRTEAAEDPANGTLGPGETAPTPAPEEATASRPQLSTSSDDLESTLTERFVPYTCGLGHAHLGLFRERWGGPFGFDLPLDPGKDGARAAWAARLICVAHARRVLRYTRHIDAGDRALPYDPFVWPVYERKEDFLAHKAELDSNALEICEVYHERPGPYSVDWWRYKRDRLARELRRLQAEPEQESFANCCRAHWLKHEFVVAKRRLLRAKVWASPAHSALFDRVCAFETEEDVRTVICECDAAMQISVGRTRMYYDVVRAFAHVALLAYASGQERLAAMETQRRLIEWEDPASDEE